MAFPGNLTKKLLKVCAKCFSGIDTVSSKLNHFVFHCGTAAVDGNLVTNGGRVLITVAIAPQLTVAAANATRACELITFDGEQHRNDIAHKGIARLIKIYRFYVIKKLLGL